MMAFYGSPEGQSAWKKFSPYMNEIMPQIQTEVRKAAAGSKKATRTRGASRHQGTRRAQSPAGAAGSKEPKAQPAPPASKESKDPSPAREEEIDRSRLYFLYIKRLFGSKNTLT